MLNHTLLISVKLLENKKVKAKRENASIIVNAYVYTHTRKFIWMAVTILILNWSNAVSDISDFFLLSPSPCSFGQQLFRVCCLVDDQTFIFEGCESSVILPFLFFNWCNFPSVLNIGDRSIKRNPREHSEFFLPSLCSSNSDFTC